MADFTRYRCWQRAQQLVVRVYEVSGDLPPSESYGLVMQLRRGAVSIPSNIAEGAGRGSDKDFARFLTMAIGSANELESQLMLLGELRMMDTTVVGQLITELRQVRRLTSALRRRLIGSDSSTGTQGR